MKLSVCSHILMRINIAKEINSLYVQEEKKIY